MSGQEWVIVALAALLLLVTTWAVVLQRRLRVVAADREETPAAPVTTAVDRDVEYVITSVGADARHPSQGSGVHGGGAPVGGAPVGVVLSATLGEPLVKAVALAHGVRRALSPANRNRIGFEVRQEVRRSRKVRRQEMRTAWREMKARERAQRPAQSAENVEGAA